MRVLSVELRELRIPLVRFFETSFGRTVQRRIVLLSIRTDSASGYGECTASEEPLYSHETTETAWHVLRDFLIPRVLRQEFETPGEVAHLFEPIRGHNMAKATLETALWDAEARRRGLPLSRLLGGVRSSIPCGVSIGIQASVEELLELVRREVSAGYLRVKIKIRPGWEVEPVRAIRSEFPDLPLMVDANSAFTLEDLPLFQRMDEFHLMMIEQPLGYSDLVDHAKLQSRLRTPICLDESILSAQDARKALELGSCRIINVKLGRVGGYSEALRLNDYCVRQGIPLWCGGMLESGVGRAHNIALSTLSAFTLPGDVSASRRYYEEDTIRPPVTVSPDGTIQIPDRVGIGFDLDWERIGRATVRVERFE